jgi:hypothetical protein
MTGLGVAMTMVLAAMTDNHVFVVSDRRATSGRTGKVMSSTENKAAVLHGEMVLTYTGFCDLDGVPTDAWVAKVLANEPVENWIRTLLNQVGPAVRRVRVAPDKQRHTFLLTGYAKTLKGHRPFRPVGYLISNSYGPDGRLLRNPEEKFSLSILPLGNWKVRVDSIGRVLSDRRRRALEQAVRTQLRATPDKPRRVLDILSREIRDVAQGDAGVGQDLMAISFPIAAVGSALNLAIDPTCANWQQELVALYEGIDSTAVSYGPADIRPNMQIFGMSVSQGGAPATLHRLIAPRW